LEVTSPIADTYLVQPERPVFGQSEASGAVGVWYYRRSGVWACEKCGAANGTTRPECLHVRFVRDSLETES
jgi:hypothetical protein